MTALRKYARLEACGVWRPSAEAQRRDVIVSVGEAMLVISDSADKPLAHWSLAAIARDGSDVPAVYFPDGNSGETLELPADEGQMIEAIETLRRAVFKARPHPGRLRWLGAALSIGAISALCVFWVPNALLDHAVRVVPDVNRTALGAQIFDRLTRVSGPACKAPGSARALDLLAGRAGVAEVHIVQEGVATSLYLPGRVVVLNKAIVEDYEEPDVAAGYVLAAALSGEDVALRDVLSSGGVRATVTMLTTGTVSAPVVDAYVEEAALRAEAAPDTAAMLAAFEAAQITSTPYAYARDISGETTLALIEADPLAGRDAAPIMRDADWLRLQSICDG